MADVTPKLTLLVAARLQPNQLERHLEPLVLLDEVERILLVRHAPIGPRLPKIEHRGFADRGTTLNTVQMFRTIDEVLKAERVDWVLGFNPIPWGSVAWAAAKRNRVRAAISLLGTDYKRLMHPLARPMWHPVKSADLVTVPGERMRTGLVQNGVGADKVHVLPHAIDIERFKPSDAKPEYDIVYAGQLVAVKRVDVLIDAIARMPKTPRVAIVGDGPLREELAARIARHGLTDRIDLLGFRADVERVVQSARIGVLTSESEGMPFAMLEAMASGLVPVVTDVGAITDVVVDGENGRIIASPDPGAFARVLDELLADETKLARMREAALRVRERISLPAAVRFWRERLGSTPASTPATPSRT